MMMIRTEKLSKQHAYNLYSFSNNFYKQVSINSFNWPICEILSIKERDTIARGSMYYVKNKLRGGGL